MSIHLNIKKYCYFCCTCINCVTTCYSFSILPNNVVT